MRFAAVFLLGAACLCATEPDVEPAFDHFYNLEFDDAIRGFRAEVKAQPNDPASYAHLAQGILYRELYRAGALESELVTGNNSFLRRAKMNPPAEAMKEFDDTIEKDISLCEARLAKDSKDVMALYYLGIGHGLRANFNYLVRKAWMDGLRDATAARRAHGRITDIDPSFVDARLTQGVYSYLVASLPWHLRVLGFVAGFRGDREGGIKTLMDVAQNGKYTKYDAQIILAALYRREREPAKAIEIVRPLLARFPRNYLFRLEMGQMYGDLGDKDQALASFDSVEQLRRDRAPGYAHIPEEKIAYYRGTLLFWYNDLDRALVEMKKVAARPTEVDLNSAILAWMRIGQIEDMKGNRKQAVEAYKKAVALAPQSDAVKEARGYIGSPYRVAAQS
jgi:tetratricopeptide (TPR) repeat protein